MKCLDWPETVCSTRYVPKPEGLQVALVSSEQVHRLNITKSAITNNLTEKKYYRTVAFSQLLLIAMIDLDKRLLLFRKPKKR